MDRPGFLEICHTKTYVDNQVETGRVVEYRVATLRGTATVHQVAQMVGGSRRHALHKYAYENRALCGARPTGGFGSRGSWNVYRAGSVYGVTCEKCQRLEPTPAAEASLEVVLARCISDER